MKFAPHSQAPSWVLKEIMQMLPADYPFQTGAQMASCNEKYNNSDHQSGEHSKHNCLIITLIFQF